MATITAMATVRMRNRLHNRGVFRGNSRHLFALAARSVVAIAAIVMSLWLVLAVSIAGVMRNASPAVALRWAPHDAAASANQAQFAVAADQSQAVLQLARSTSQDALRRDPTIGAAIRVFGMIASARGDDATAFTLYSTAERLSRRDQAAQLWLIQYYSRLSDGEAAVRHFDRAMRTSERNWGNLLPFMAMASADPRLIPPLARLLAERPRWRVNFMQDLAQRGSRLEHVVVLTRGQLDPSIPNERLVLQSLLDRLVAASRYDLGWQVYASIPGAGQRRADVVRNGDFEQSEGFAPFDWALVDEADLWARRDIRADGRGGGVLTLAASNGRSGEVARQVVKLGRGQYLFQVDVGQLPATDIGQPTFAITCVGAAGSPLLSVRAAAAGAGPFRISRSFSVSENCAWQVISIRIDGDVSLPGPPWIDNLVIRRITS